MFEDHVDPKVVAKWQVWHDCSGISKEEAARQYIHLLMSYDPSWSPKPFSTSPASNATPPQVGVVERKSRGDRASDAGSIQVLWPPSRVAWHRRAMAPQLHHRHKRSSSSSESNRSSPSCATRATRGQRTVQSLETDESGVKAPLIRVARPATVVVTVVAREEATKVTATAKVMAWLREYFSSSATCSRAGASAFSASKTRC